MCLYSLSDPVELTLDFRFGIEFSHMIFHSMNMRIFVLCYEFSFNYLQITTRICYPFVGALAPINLIKITINHTFLSLFLSYILLKKFTIFNVIIPIKND